MITAESLVEFAGGHGIDLVSAAQAGLRTDGVARIRRLTFRERVERMGRPVLPTAAGTQTRVYRRPGWTEHDLGFALGGGCPKMPELAAWFAWGRDDKDFGELFRGLMMVAVKMCGTWPRTLWHGEVHYHYLAALTNLVFESDRHAQHYALSGAPLYAARMGINTDTWRVRMEGRFLHLRGRFEGWQEEALHHMHGRIYGRRSA